MALDAYSQTLVVYIVALDIKSTNIVVHLSWAAHIGLLKVNKTLTIVRTEFSDYTEIFSYELIAEIPKYTSINNHIIELEEGKKPPYH